MINHKPWISKFRVASTNLIKYVCKLHRLKNYECQKQDYKETVQEPRKGAY